MSRTELRVYDWNTGAQISESQNMFGWSAKCGTLVQEYIPLGSYNREWGRPILVCASQLGYINFCVWPVWPPGRGPWGEVDGRRWWVWIWMVLRLQTRSTVALCSTACHNQTRMERTTHTTDQTKQHKITPNSTINRIHVGKKRNLQWSKNHISPTIRSCPLTASFDL